MQNMPHVELSDIPMSIFKIYPVEKKGLSVYICKIILYIYLDSNDKLLLFEFRQS